jgi:hypothetical protein
MRALEWSKSQRQKVEWAVARGQRRREVAFNRHRVSVSQDEKLDTADVCTTLWMCLLPAGCTLTIVKIANILCVFYQKNPKKQKTLKQQKVSTK